MPKQIRNLFVGFGNRNFEVRRRVLVHPPAFYGVLTINPEISESTSSVPVEESYLWVVVVVQTQTQPRLMPSNPTAATLWPQWERSGFTVNSIFINNIIDSLVAIVFGESVTVSATVCIYYC
jgi:hypothetical protein